MQYSNYGYWPAAIFMIVIVSWLFYRFVAPKRWRDWSRAGLVQAFIIALYAEMYGFPLTLYVLGRVFGIDAAASGNLWSTLFGGGEAAMTVAMVVGTAFLLFGVVLIARGWAAIHRAKREERLVTDGVYGVVRHPQYTGIFFALFGEGVVHWPTLFSVLLFPVIVFAYVRLAKKEENKMMERFGDAYLAYRDRVPRFFPRRGEWRRFLRAALGGQRVRHIGPQSPDAT